MLGWLDAELDCESRGGYLFTITNRPEQDFIYAEITRFFDTTTMNLGIWMGFLDDGFDFSMGGEFYWITNEPVTFSAWFSGEPSASGEHCGEFRDNLPGPGGAWNDDSCPKFQHYVCETAMTPKVYTDCPAGKIYQGILRDCLDCPGEINPANDHCYFFMGGRRNWLDIATLCEKSAGYTVTVNDANEELWFFFFFFFFFFFWQRIVVLLISGLAKRSAFKCNFFVIGERSMELL